MKKKLVKQLCCAVLAASLLLSFAGCQNPLAKKQASSAASSPVSSSVSGTASGTVSPAKTGETPVLGDEDAGYEGFEYLYAETLSTQSKENKETGKMESQNLTVYLPRDEYNSVNRTRAYSNRMGVNFEVDIEPMLQYKSEDYTLPENLQYVLDMEYDPEYAYYQNIKVGAIEENKETKSARAVVTYTAYDEYDKSFTAYTHTYFLRQLDNGLMVMAEAQVSSVEATGKTPDLLQELEAFYGCKFEWDAADAKKRITEAEKAGPPVSSESANSTATLPVFDSAVKNADGTFTDSGLTFSLPEGWDYSADYGTYAPGGDPLSNQSAITLTVMQNEGFKGYVTAIKASPDATITLLTDLLKSEIGAGLPSDMTLTLVENPPFGVALKLAGTQDSVKISGYLLFDDAGNMFVIGGQDFEGATAGAEAADKLLSTLKKAA